MSSSLSYSASFAAEAEEEGEQVRLIKVVEYVGSPLCEELLCKFPDTSAFDFDYTQSSIWSPLVPRTHRSLPLSWDWRTPPSKLSYGFGFDKATLKKVAATLKNSLFTAFKKKQKKRRRRSFIKPSSTPPSTKGWSKVLKAASNHFKKKKKKKDLTTLHVKLSSFSTPVA